MVSFVLWRRDAKIKIALAVSSPADNDGIKGFGGFLRRATMSKAVCLRKSLMLTSGKLIFLGKNKTVSESISALVEGIKHLTHL